MKQTQKKSLILGSLCALVLMLVVGYAAFSTVLKINGTANISSNWNVLITDVTEGTKVGTATTKNKSEGQDTTQCKNNLCNPTWSGTTASIETDLVSPGDSIEYNITVSNEGNINAKLDKITLSDPKNEYIEFTAEIEGEKLSVGNNTTFTEKAQTLNAGDSKVLKVTVAFKNVEIDTMESTSASLTITLDYSQADGSSSNTPIIPSQPDDNVVYRWEATNLYLGDSIEGIETTIDPTTLGKNEYLKHEIDSENKIIASYLCFVTDTEHCMKPNDYDNSVALLQSQETWFINNGGSCSGKDNCFGGAFDHVRVSSDGLVSVWGDGGCVIAPDGYSYCDTYVHDHPGGSGGN